MKHFGLEFARDALARWEGEPATLEHLATSGNDVYRFLAGNEPRVLRVTDVDYRSLAHNQAEAAFLDHLKARGVRLAAPIPSRSGRLVEPLEGASACVLTWAPGERLEPTSAEASAPLLRTWGRHLAEIHVAARTYAGPPRWEWWDEVFLAQAPRLLPADDPAARRELEQVVAHLRALPRDAATYGMIHHDLGPQNFHVDGHGAITSFDYGNCCHHFFVMDLVISLSVLRRRPDREAMRALLLSGYREVAEIPDALWVERRWFARLRFAYVYLSRLMQFRPDRTPDQREQLSMFRSLLGGGEDWP